MIGKKGGFFDFWAEILFVGILVLAYLLKLMAVSTVSKIVITIICGLYFGKVAYKRRSEAFLFFAVLLAFLYGFLVGTSGFEKILVLVLFIGSYKGMHWLIDNKYV